MCGLLSLCLIYRVLRVIHENSKSKGEILLQMYQMPIYGVLSVTRFQMAGKARYMLYREMPLDLVIGEPLVGCTLVLTSGGTSSRQNLGPSGPRRI